MVVMLSSDELVVLPSVILLRDNLDRNEQTQLKHLSPLLIQQLERLVESDFRRLLTGWKINDHTGFILGV